MAIHLWIWDVSFVRRPSIPNSLRIAPFGTECSICMASFLYTTEHESWLSLSIGHYNDHATGQDLSPLTPVMDLALIQYICDQQNNPWLLTSVKGLAGPGTSPLLQNVKDQFASSEALEGKDLYLQLDNKSDSLTRCQNFDVYCTSWNTNDAAIVAESYTDLEFFSWSSALGKKDGKWNWLVRVAELAGLRFGPMVWRKYPTEVGLDYYTTT